MSKVSFGKVVNYPPWIGSNYGDRGNIRLLLVGRSYYDARYRDKSIADYIGYLCKKSTNDDTYYSALELVLSEGRHWKGSLGGKMKLDRKKFWNSLCFHQFIQGILTDGYTPPGKALWKEGQELFKEALISLQPDVVVMTGRDVFNHMPTLGGRNGRTYEWQGEKMKTWVLDLGQTDCRIAEMAYPRDTSFDTGIWKELYQQFLSDYKNDNKLTSFSSG